MSIREVKVQTCNCVVSMLENLETYRYMSVLLRKSDVRMNRAWSSEHH